eukprot:ANDGO_03403.mRNA.1 hypothetical protein
MLFLLKCLDASGSQSLREWSTNRKIASMQRKQSALLAEMNRVFASPPPFEALASCTHGSIGLLEDREGGSRITTIANRPNRTVSPTEGLRVIVSSSVNAQGIASSLGISVDEWAKEKVLVYHLTLAWINGVPFRSTPSYVPNRRTAASSKVQAGAFEDVVMKKVPAVVNVSYLGPQHSVTRSTRIALRANVRDQAANVYFLDDWIPLWETVLSEQSRLFSTSAPVANPNALLASPPASRSSFSNAPFLGASSSSQPSSARSSFVDPSSMDAFQPRLQGGSQSQSQSQSQSYHHQQQQQSQSARSSIIGGSVTRSYQDGEGDDVFEEISTVSPLGVSPIMLTASNSTGESQQLHSSSTSPSQTPSQQSSLSLSQSQSQSQSQSPAQSQLHASPPPSNSSSFSSTTSNSNYPAGASESSQGSESKVPSRSSFPSSTSQHISATPEQSKTQQHLDAPPPATPIHSQTTRPPGPLAQKPVALPIVVTSASNSAAVSGVQLVLAEVLVVSFRKSDVSAPTRKRDPTAYASGFSRSSPFVAIGSSQLSIPSHHQLSSCTEWLRNLIQEKEVARAERVRLQRLAVEEEERRRAQCGKIGKYAAWLCRSCGLGPKATHCVVCDQWAPQGHRAMLCLDHGFGSRAKNCAKCGKFVGGAEIPAVLCNDHGYGEKSSNCAAMYKI